MTVIQNLIHKKAAVPSTSSSQRSSSSSTNNMLSRSKRTLNQFIYLTFIVIIFGALIRIYVYEQDDNIIVGSRSSGRKGNRKNDVLIASLEAFKSTPHSKNADVVSHQGDARHYHTLRCESYGGPSEEEAQEMVYWQGTYDIREKDRRSACSFSRGTKTQLTLVFLTLT